MMYSSKEDKRNTTRSSSYQEENKKKTVVLSSAILGGFLIVGMLALWFYQHFQAPVVKNWVNLDIVAVTGDNILEQRTVSIKNINLDDPFKDNPDYPMYLSVKKIDGKDSVWLIDSRNNFYCVSNTNKKCSLKVSFDKNSPELFFYEGGTKKTVYITDSSTLINKIKKSTEIKISADFKREMSPNDHTSWGRYSPYTTKEYTFKVDGLIWQ